MARSRKGGVLLPAATNATNVVAVPVVKYNLATLDERQYRGYEMYRKLREGGKDAPRVAKLDDVSTVYISADAKQSAYVVKRESSNTRGSLTITSRCSCPDFLANLRSGCKHTFCEQLRRKEATTFGDPPKRTPRLRAQRRAPVKRMGRNGKSERSNQRSARVEMPTRVPELIDSLRAVDDRRLRNEDEQYGVARLKNRGRQKTSDATRAATLLLKVSNGLSADAMVARYKAYIASDDLPLRRPPHQNTLTNWMNDAALEPVLHRMFRETILPFRQMETTGIMDSTQFSNADTIRSRGVQYRGDVRPDARWLAASTDECKIINV